jgi:hypothetical protein
MHFIFAVNLPRRSNTNFLKKRSIFFLPAYSETLKEAKGRQPGFAINVKATLDGPLAGLFRLEWNACFDPERFAFRTIQHIHLLLVLCSNKESFTGVILD